MEITQEQIITIADGLTLCNNVVRNLNDLSAPRRLETDNMIAIVVDEPMRAALSIALSVDAPMRAALSIALSASTDALVTLLEVMGPDVQALSPTLYQHAQEAIERAKKARR